MAAFFERKKKPLVGLALIIGMILVDQLTKWAIVERVLMPARHPDMIPLGLVEWFGNPDKLGPVSITVFPFFNLSMVWNHGISFGLFQSDTPYFLIGLALLISVIFAVWLWRSTAWTQAIALSMVIGGALGNVIDRFHFGAVADFFDFHIMGWHYPAFNMADSFITIGIAILVFDSVFLEPKRNPSK
ncbi:MAG: signal peptidase II [Alphaproteobacteria bacterium]|nr:signal peptidase II [Alphaproteobacteria bacterium]NCQ88809.1 signal peptidase II [Alphaproteobacteria bacterium]NCT07268.1 signal peptidase II [Alphaproteobacteria bacterium]